MPSFTPVPIPPLTGKVILITGANSGLGEALLTSLAAHHPKKIYLAARSPTKAAEALARIRTSTPQAQETEISILQLDLASFASIKSAAEHVKSDTQRLDILHLNGGIASTAYALTPDGYELTFGTNYLGHILLVQLLLPLLLSTTLLPHADVRIIAISSVAHKVFIPTEGINFPTLTTPCTSQSGMSLYGQSNLARTLFAYEFAKRYPAITTTSVHPGTVRSNIWNGEKKGMHPLLQYFVFPLAVYFSGVGVEEGCQTQVWCSVVGRERVENGAYYEPVGRRGDGRLTRDDDLAGRLWEWTEEELRKGGGPGWVEG